MIFLIKYCFSSPNSNQLSYPTSFPIKKLFYDKINLQVVFFYKQFYFISGSRTKLEFTRFLLKVVQLPNKYGIMHQDATPKYTHFSIFNGITNYIDCNEKGTIKFHLCTIKVSMVYIIDQLECVIYQCYFINALFDILF